jgi:hypothetical protein
VTNLNGLVSRSLSSDMFTDLVEAVLEVDWDECSRQLVTLTKME